MYRKREARPTEPKCGIGPDATRLSFTFAALWERIALRDPFLQKASALIRIWKRRSGNLSRFA